MANVQTETNTNAMKIVNRTSLLGLLAAACCSALALAHAGDTAAINDVLKLKTAGVADETIVAFIESKGIDYQLSAADILALHEKGVSSAVLKAMVSSGAGNERSEGTSPSSGNAPQPASTNATQTLTYTGQIPDAPTAPLAPTIGAPAAPAAASNPDVAYYYQELSPYGRWMLVEDGRWCWQPSIVVSDPSWRPYWDNGHWIYTDSGWYWSSDYPWGWAAFHYGRWQLHPHLGWIWFPDRVWGPGWVTWRSGGEYCGWAPLPPGAIFDVGAGRFRYHGQLVGLDFDFGLGWMNFNFAYVRDLGGPMRWHPHKESEYHDIFDHTRFIGGYRVGRSIMHGEPRDHIFNGGIQVKHVEEVRGRPINSLKIEDLRVHVGRGAYERMDPDGKRLETYRPHFEQHNEHRDDHGRH